MEHESEPEALELGPELDLHTFRPRDIPSVVEEYLNEARRRGWRQVRLVHGRGIGYQRDVVRRVALAWGATVEDDVNGNWGATWVTLPEGQRT